MPRRPAPPTGSASRGPAPTAREAGRSAGPPAPGRTAQCPPGVREDGVGRWPPPGPGAPRVAPSRRAPARGRRRALLWPRGSPEQELRAERGRGRRPAPALRLHREEMSHAGPLSRNVFLSTFLQEHGPEVLDVPGMTDLVEYYDPGPSPNSNSPDDVAMRLAFIGDEMEVRWMMPRVGELPGMAVYSLAFTYNQTGLRGVLRSLMDGLANLRENIRIWGFLTLRNRVSPNSGRGLALSLLLLVLLLGWGLHLLQ
ncbi:bcl-2-interacting killer isoform X1 [Acinonyx jubatus]|uniref:Bcl-2-interacting killer isoform X1 n=2 Tax=Acinonyx jubatus TaxID=32536 RepID=A0A6J2A938_ACIJB|nr:bcl-2-interacting killer isoform X1 [Acinonyx jubatus]